MYVLMFVISASVGTAKRENVSSKDTPGRTDDHEVGNILSTLACVSSRGYVGLLPSTKRCSFKKRNLKEEYKLSLLLLLLSLYFYQLVGCFCEREFRLFENPR